jgi:hypothetical protein
MENHAVTPIRESAKSDSRVGARRAIQKQHEEE